MSDETTLRISLGHSLAYHRLHAQDDGRSVPGIVFLSGFKSDMRGIKATWLADWCAKSGRAFVRFDYRGHGESTGSFADLGIGDWAADACHVIDQLTEGPQILVGSSMGGWIALLLARLRPESIAGLVGIAAAPDFTEGLLRSRLTAEQLEAIELEGRVEVPSQYSDDPYIYSRKLLHSAGENLVLQDRLSLPFPVRLLHGGADPDVPVSVSVDLLDHADCPDARLTIEKGADHRFSTPQALDLIVGAIEDIDRRWTL